MCFVYIATLYGGSIRLSTPMLWALAFLGEFLIGGVTGIYLGASGLDVFFHDTYFVVAHFHYTFFPIAIIAVFSGLTFWFPKMFGRMMNETWGKIHFWGTIIPFNFIFIPLFFLGMNGEHRRHLRLPLVPAARHALHAHAARHGDRVTRRDAAVPDPVHHQLHRERDPWPEGGQESVAREHARVDDRFSAAARQLAARRHARGPPRPLRVCRAGRTEDFWPQNERA
jgi:hypothetical protein